MFGCRILIVDDDDNNAALLYEYLSLSGCSSHRASNGKEALRWLAGNKTDLILLDIQMPEMDGFQTLQKIRQQISTDLPVIFLSSFDRPNLKVKGLEMGAEDYITKPFNRAELIARIKVVMRRSMRFAQVERNMGGDLSDMPLPVLLQSLQLGGQSATVRLANPAGTIHIENGQFLSAALTESPLSGERALLVMLLLANGAFKIEFAKHPGTTHAEAVPMETILMRLAPEMDEVLAVIQQYSVRIDQPLREFLLHCSAPVQALPEFFSNKQERS